MFVLCERARPSGRPVQAQMSGKLPGDHVLRVPWRFNSGMAYRNILVSSPPIKSSFRPYDNPNMAAFNTTLDLSGGFYEDGPWGPVKLTKNNGFSTAMLAWAMLDAEESFRDNKDIEVRLPSIQAVGPTPPATATRYPAAALCHALCCGPTVPKQYDPSWVVRQGSVGALWG